MIGQDQSHSRQQEDPGIKGHMVSQAEIRLQVASKKKKGSRG